MATHASALKRQRQNEKQRERNRSIQSTIRTLAKKVRSSANKQEAQKNLIAVVSQLHKGSQKGGLHPRNVARHISRLQRLVNSGTPASKTPA